MKEKKIEKKSALISVSDKRNIVEFATGLISLGYSIISTGGTAKILRAAGLQVEDVSSHTGFPEIMDGRVKTLHPKIHGGLLARLEDEEVVKEFDINLIDLLVVNLYPFERTVADQRSSFDEIIENIDIGGPAMLRAAAKNHNRVGAVCDKNDYQLILDELGKSGSLSQETKLHLSMKAFDHTSGYDNAIARFLRTKNVKAKISEKKAIMIEKVADLRYGENPHQNAEFYKIKDSKVGYLSKMLQFSGKQLSYNNIVDLDTAVRCVASFQKVACCIVKHANPCGVSESESLKLAYLNAFSTDKKSAFGGVIAFNRKVDVDTAKLVLENQFVEVIAAPEFDQKAVELIKLKENVRVIKIPLPENEIIKEIKSVSDMILIQDQDLISKKEEFNEFVVVSKRNPSEIEEENLFFAWKVAAFVKSNAIVFASRGQTVGIGAGQMSRVYSAKIAALKAKDEEIQLEGSSMASDAFFPFRDGIDQAFSAGVTAVIQPGGSVKDSEVIAAANEYNMAMIFTGRRHFRH